MALTTTIGSASADSYATAAEYTARASAMGWTIGATAETDLRKAAQALDALWLQDAYGTRQYEVQALQFPRVNMPLINGWPVYPDTIPAAVKVAQMEMAYLIQGGATPLAVIDATVASERVKAGPVESETVYMGGKARPSYPSVYAVLRPFLSASRLVRS